MADNKNMLERIKSFFSPEIKSETKKDVRADYTNGGGSYRLLFATGFNGEKNLGELGPVKDYKPDYGILRLRSWQSFLESDMTQTIIGRKVMWVIGKGLRLQCEPAKRVLTEEGITTDIQKFCEITESRFNLFKESASCDYSGMNTLDELASENYKNSIVGGDVLVVLRLIDDTVKVQLIDGAHVQSPVLGNEIWPQILANGNMIRNGIERDPTRKIVAYHVRCWEDPSTVFKTVRIPARIEGLDIECAWLDYGLKFRLDSERGLPLLSTVLESLKKLERYKEATVGSAEERQKIVYAVEHTRDSTGESPLANRLAKAYDTSNPDNEDLPRDIEGKALANTVAASTNKQAFNMPIGASLKSLSSVNELSFKDFYGTNADIVCGSAQIPPNVAFSKYEDSFSASRAALMDWQTRLSLTENVFHFTKRFTFSGFTSKY
jgi:hypothetical protein